MSAIIEARDLTKVFERGTVRVEALRGVSVEVPGAQFVAIVGASGSGKSTFMSILGCLDRPTAGSYWLGGSDVSSLEPDERAEIRNRQIGFVFQAFNLIPRLTALENVELPLFYGAQSQREQRRLAAGALASVGLAERATHFPAELSGGEQQRVAIARALVNRPAILLADEPTGNLDSANGREIMELFARLHRDQGLTIVVVTHATDVAAYAQRTLTFRDGRVVDDVERGEAKHEKKHKKKDKKKHKKKDKKKHKKRHEKTTDGERGGGHGVANRSEARGSPSRKRKQGRG